MCCCACAGPRCSCNHLWPHHLFPPLCRKGSAGRQLRRGRAPGRVPASWFVAEKLACLGGMCTIGVVRVDVIAFVLCFCRMAWVGMDLKAHPIPTHAVGWLPPASSAALGLILMALGTYRDGANSKLHLQGNEHSYFGRILKAKMVINFNVYGELDEFLMSKE